MVPILGHPQASPLLEMLTDSMTARLVAEGVLKWTKNFETIDKRIFRIYFRLLPKYIPSQINSGIVLDMEF